MARSAWEVIGKAPEAKKRLQEIEERRRKRLELHERGAEAARIYKSGKARKDLGK